MIKIIASILILLNPVTGFFIDGKQKNDAPPQAPVFISQEERLPLSADIFLASHLLPVYPIRKWTVPDPEIASKTALVFETSRQMILFQKNGLEDSRPIASLTKLMTALVAVENASPDDVFVVSKEAVMAEGEQGGMHVGEEITLKNLLYAMLVESSNDAALAVGENITAKTGRDFAQLMNEKAAKLELKQSAFADPSGLDPGNKSSAWDLCRLMEEAIKNPMLSEIMQTALIQVPSKDGKFIHYLKSTNKLLGRVPDIVGGKTGYTQEAGNCMVVAVKSPNEEGNIITVVMDAGDRMVETESLINWTKNAFFW